MKADVTPWRSACRRSSSSSNVTFSSSVWSAAREDVADDLLGRAFRERDIVQVQHEGTYDAVATTAATMSPAKRRGEPPILRPRFTVTVHSERRREPPGEGAERIHERELGDDDLLLVAPPSLSETERVSSLMRRAPSRFALTTDSSAAAVARDGATVSRAMRRPAG